MNRIYIVNLFFLAWLCVGCDKFLDKEPENKVSVDVLFSDISGAKAALTGVYLNLWSSDYYNGARMVYPEVTGGNVKPINSKRQSFIDVYTFTAEADSSSMNSLYANGYAILNNINNIISRVALLNNGSPLERNNILAQAYGLRALLHLDLVKLYAQPFAYTADASHLGIVLATAPILVADAQRSRATVAAVYTQIEADLQQAKALFANSKPVFTGASSIYMGSNVVQALLARLALDKADWQQAYDYSSSLIAGAYSLYSNSEYTASWTKLNAKETIFELAPPTGFTGNSLGHYYTNNAANEYYQFTPSADLIALFTQGDMRASGGIFKYPTYGAAASSVKLIRLSEIYLIRAEAAAQLGLSQQAIQDLNKIRLRANPQQEAWTDTNKSKLTKEIADERRRELCLEGFYFFDLGRRAEDLVRKDCQGNNCNMSFPSNHYVLPIPAKTVNANGNMLQNPGY